MKDYALRLAEAKAYSERGHLKVQTTPVPAGQKFQPGTRVKIADDLGTSMAHFPSGVMATGQYTYAHAFGGDDVKSYCLDVDGFGENSWYEEHQLEAVE